MWPAAQPQQPHPGDWLEIQNLWPFPSQTESKPAFCCVPQLISCTLKFENHWMYTASFKSLACRKWEDVETGLAIDAHGFTALFLTWTSHEHVCAYRKRRPLGIRGRSERIEVADVHGGSEELNAYTGGRLA